MDPANRTPTTRAVRDDEQLGRTRVMIIGAGELVGHQLAREAARRQPDRLFLVDGDESRLSLLAAYVPSTVRLIITDPDDRQAMGALFERYRPDIVIHVTAPVDALVDGAGDAWPEGIGADTGWLAVAAAEAGCTQFTQVSKTSLFDSSSMTAVGERNDPEASDASLRAALENERANAEHLRRLTRQQKELLRRKLVRLALALDEQAHGLSSSIGTRRRRMNRRVAKVGLIAQALPRRGELAERRRELAVKMADIARLDDGPKVTRRISIIMVTDQPMHELPRVDEDLNVEFVVVLNGRKAKPPAVGSPLIVRTEYKTPAAAAAAGAAKASGRLLCFLATTSEPLDDGWVGRLAQAVGGDTLAATPMLVHPERPIADATPHDLHVRELGLDVVAAGDSGPIAVAREAGTAARPERVPVEVPAASGACLVVDRQAFDEAGGLTFLDDFDSAIVDLCGRLRAGGGRVMTVPTAVVVDHRPVRSVRALSWPIDPESRAWRTLVDRQGPTLLQMARGDRVTEHLRFAFTVAAPSARVANQWGDWHLAEAMARSLRRIGHSVHIQTADQADNPAGRACDVHLVFRGMASVQRTPGQRHVLWMISHPEAIDIRECEEADLVLVASERLAADLRARVSTPVELLLQATDHRRFGIRPPEPEHAHAVAAVATTRHVFRPSVAYALAAGFRPAIYGTGWREFVDPDLIVAEFVDNKQLATVYSSVGVLLNDHWDTMRAWGVVSNRIFDALACGTPIVSDHLPEVADLFGDSVAMFRDVEDLRHAVDLALDDPVAARRRAAEGREIVLRHHTFDHRAEDLLHTLARHGLDRPPK